MTPETDDRKIKYLEHPVTASEKKKWIKAGFKIIDARFAPAKDASGMDPSKMKVGELKDALDVREIEYTDDDKKADLAAMLQAALDDQ